MKSDLTSCSASFFSLVSGLRTRLGLGHPWLGVKQSYDLSKKDLSQVKTVLRDFKCSGLPPSHLCSTLILKHLQWELKRRDMYLHASSSCVHLTLLQRTLRSNALREGDTFQQKTADYICCLTAAMAKPTSPNRMLHVTSPVETLPWIATLATLARHLTS